MSARPARQEVRHQLAALARDLFWIRASVEEAGEWEAAYAISDVEDDLLALRDKLREREA